MPPSPRALVDVNLRDLAAASLAAPKLRPGQLYRSGHLAGTTEAQRRALDGLSLRTIVDLRGTDERERTGLGHLPPGAERILLPIPSARLGRQFARALRSGDGGIESDTLTRITASLTRAAAPQMGVLLRLAADPSRRPLLFHCTHGKDRTGFAAALVLTSLGVPWEAVRDDYLATNASPHQHSRRQGTRVVWLTRLLARTPWNSPRPEDVARLFRVQPANLEAAFDRIERHWGGPTRYLETLGMTRSRLEAFRESMITY